MNKSTYWKNFKLGKEIDVAGRFIYNGLQCFHHMQTLDHEEEIFEFLYNVAVGIERLLKVCIVLIEHTDDIDQDKFERELKTHNHQELLRRIKKKHSVKLSTVHNDFIQLIGNFYKSQRYGRFNLETNQTIGSEKVVIHQFLQKHLRVKLEEDFLFNVTRNDENAKKLIGNTIGKIAEEIFEIVRIEAHRLNIYTYDIRYGSKASKIFTFKTYNFFDEDVVWKELLVYFTNHPKNNALLNFISSIDPLDFDPAIMNEYAQCFASDVKKLLVMDEIDSHYEELHDLQDRKEKLEIIGNPQAYFMDTEDDANEENDDDYLE